MKAFTPTGREVEIVTGTLYGTSNPSYSLTYGGFPVAYWSMHGSGNTSLEEALVAADKRIDTNRLHE
jgi:hypothetical protein